MEWSSTAAPVHRASVLLSVLFSIHHHRVHRRSQEGALGVFSVNLYQPAIACKPGHSPLGVHTASALAAQLPVLLQALLPRCCTLRLDTDSVGAPMECGINAPPWLGGVHACALIPHLAVLIV